MISSPPPPVGVPRGRAPPSYMRVSQVVPYNTPDKSGSSGTSMQASSGETGMIGGNADENEVSTPIRNGGVAGRVSTPFLIASGASAGGISGSRDGWGVNSSSTFHIPAFQQQSFMLRSPGFMEQQQRPKTTPVETPPLSIRTPQQQQILNASPYPSLPDLSRPELSSKVDGEIESEVESKRVRWADDNDKPLEEIRFFDTKQTITDRVARASIFFCLPCSLCVVQRGDDF